ncbi:MAG: ATP synthase F1 subunit epsilon [Bacteroidales bacterium]|jgi:F-type H+-transporting ATPase subunit epsilon|nr:ATP synthase F1 subunit epsilon [Bacteroidales bacterium]
MHLEIITPDKKVFSGEIDSVQVPGSKGSFAVLKYHAPIISTLEKGRVKIVERGAETFFEINGGAIEVKDNNIIILAESVII